MRKPSKTYDYGATSRLWAAVGKHNAEAVRKALSEGANPNATGTKGLDGADTVLLVACEKGDGVAVRVLLEAGARQAAGREGITPLMAAARFLLREKTETALDTYLVLLNKASQVFARSQEINRPWVLTGFIPHLARAEEPSEPVRKAWEATLAKVSRKTWPEEIMESTLVAAVLRGSPDVFEAVVAAGADPQVNPGRFYSVAGEFQGRTGLPARQSTEEQAWWDVLAKHQVPLGDMALKAEKEAAEHLALARARLLESAWEAPSAPRSRGPRF